MKKFITTDENNRVQLTHYMPFDPVDGLNMTEEQLLQRGYLLDEIPEPEQREGKMPEAYYKPEIGFYYEYVDATVDPEKELAELKAQLETTQEALDFLLMN